MFRHLTLIMLLALAPLAAAQGPADAKEQKALKKSPPFLITGKMPHFTKTIKQHWDDPKLGLDDAQKKALMQLRKKTISAVQRVAKELKPLEKSVAQNALAGMVPQEQGSDVEKIARLKIEATMIHLECIYQTRTILKPQQYTYLLSL